MRQRLCKVCGEFHSFESWPRECIPMRENKRSPLGVPYIRTDGMDAVLNHADGQLYDSRSGYEKAVKAAGCEIIGNEEPFVPKPDFDAGPIEQDIKTATEQLEARL